MATIPVLGVRECLGVGDTGAGGGGGQLCIRDILIPSMGMGRSLLSDRHGIFVQFSRRKITWLGVICITELDLVTQHYPCPPARPPPQQTLTHTRTHTLTAPPPCLPSLCKTTNYQINIPNSARSLHSSGQQHSKTCQENKCKRENALWVLVAVCVRL